MLHRDGSYRWMLVRGIAVHGIDGKPYRMAGSQTDITESKVADALTGLPNRILFSERLGHCILRQRSDPDYLFAVMFLDLDGFKVVNDSLGHMIGDELLRAIAERLEASLRCTDVISRPGPGNVLARLGGDEFAILLHQIKHTDDAVGVAERLQQRLALPFRLRSHEIFTTASIGIASSSQEYERPEEMLRDADTAMYRAKARGKARCEVFDAEMRRDAIARLEVETDLRRAIERHELVLYYQSILSLEDVQIHGFEALVRWKHPQRGLLLPSEFIEIAEETGLIVSLGRWVLEEACRQIARWQKVYAPDPPFVSVNVSPKQFYQPDLWSR